MANRNSKFLLKRSNTPGKVPLPGDLLLGELALNTADVILYTSGTTANQILPIGWDRLSITGGTVTGNVTINGTTTSSGLTLTNITNATGDFITIDGSNVIKKRTPAQVLSDIGGQTALTNPVTGTGSVGQVSFWNGTTTQTGDNGLFWDDTNKRLGIGVTAPPVTLSVQGISYFADDIYLRDGSTTTGDFLVRIYDSSDDGIIDVYRNNAVVNRIHGNGNSFITAGLFGIGTTSPEYMLDVVGSTTTGNVTSVRLRRSTAGVNDENAILWQSSTLTTASISDLVESASAGSLVFKTAISSTLNEAMRITSGGNVGIGLTSPTERLHVSGNTLITGTIEVDTVNNSVGDFLTITSGGVITRRTATEVRTDIGAPGNNTEVIFNQSGVLGSSNTVRITTGGFHVTRTGSIFQSLGNTAFSVYNSDTSYLYVSQGVSAGGTETLFNIVDNGTSGFSPMSILSTATNGSPSIGFFNNTYTSSVFDVFYVGSNNSAHPTNPHAAYLFNYSSKTNAHILFGTNLTLRWSILRTGEFQSNGAQTIRTSTGNLTLATNGGNGNIILSPNGTGNVGIGTTTPSQKLHVVGNGLFTGTLEVDTVNNGVGDFLTRTAGGIITRRTAAEVLTDIGAQAALTNPVTGTGAAGRVAFWTGTTTQSSDAGLFWDNTNKRLGIGTTTPRRGFEVAGGVVGTETVLLQLRSIFTDNNTASTIRFANSVADDAPQGTAEITALRRNAVTSGDTDLIFRTSSGASVVERMRLLYNGNVGIGTTAPSQKLHVEGGNILLVNSGGQPHLYFTNTSQFIRWTGSNLQYSAAGHQFLNRVEVLSGNYLSVRNPDNTTVYGFDNSGATNTSILRFRNVSAGRVDMVIDNSGNVGIGTTSPLSRLQIQGSGTTSTTSALNVTNSTPTSLLFVRDDGVVSIGTSTPNGSVGKLEIGLDGITNGIGIFNGTGLSLRIWRDSDIGNIGRGTTPSISINTLNNVGIGTTTPTERLHVVGNGLFTGTLEVDTVNNGVGDFLTRTSGGIITRRTAAEVLTDIGAAPSTGSTSYIQNQNASTQTANFRISGGATADSYNSTHFGSTTSFGTRQSNSQFALSIPTTYTGGWAIGNFYNIAVTGTTVASVGLFGTDTVASRLFMSFGETPWSSTGLYVTSTNNVGIGTTSPQEKLDLRGNFYQRVISNTTSVWSLLDSGGTIRARFDLDGADASLFLRDNTNVYTIKLDSNGTSYISGNVGIGTTSPTEKLHISGNTRITGAIYDSNNESGTSGQVLTSTVTGIDWKSLSEITGVDGTGTTNFVAKWVDTDTITNSIIFDNGTNVGIGTTSPTNLLHIYTGASSVSYVARFESGFINRGVKIGALSTIGVIQGYSVSTDVDANLSLNPTGGNVGIGTTSPSQKLHVVGNGLFTGTLEVDTVNNGVGDFLTRTSGGIITRRTAAEVLSDIGASPVSGSTNYIQNQFVSAQTSSEAWLSGRFQAGNIRIDTNTISSQDTNGNITLSPNGTGFVQVSGENATRVQIGGGSRGNVTISSPFISTSVEGENRPITIGNNLFINSSGAWQKNNNFIGGSAIILGSSSTLGEFGGFTFMGMSDNDISTVVTSPLMRITGTGNVGIGTTSPSQTLHVSGNTRITGAIYDSNNEPGTSGQVLTSTVTGIDWKSLSEITGVDGTGTTNFIAKWVDTDTITNSIIFDNGTNVGIGTNTPTAKLHISNGNNTDSGLVNFSLGGNVSNGRQFGIVKNTSSPYETNIYSSLGTSLVDTIFYSNSTTETWRIISTGIFESNGAQTVRTSTGNLTLATNGGNGNIILSPNGTGNVGIGTTTPAYKLDVIGTVRIGQNSNSSTNARLDITAGGSGFDSVIDFGFFSTFDTNIWNIGRKGGTGAFFISNYNSGPEVNVVTINTSNNVGIGTTSPSRKLHVNGTAQIGNLNNTSSDTSLIIKGMAVSDGSNVFGDYGGMVMWSTSSFTAGARRYLITNALDANKFGIIRSVDSLTTPTLGVSGALTSGITDFVITNTGNVGIGTTSPAYKLDVDGEGKVTGKFRVGGAVMLAEPGTGVLLFGSEGGSQTAIYSAGAERIRINVSGNVGIGTTIPDGTLVLAAGTNGVASTGGYLGFTTGVNNSKVRGAAIETFTTGSGNDHGLRFYTNEGATSPIERLRITSTGNVGIGTTSPTYKLQVVNSGNTLLQLNGNNTAGTLDTGFTISADNLKNIYLYQRENAATILGTNNTERLRITSSGNVGIGTTTPSSIFDVNTSGNNNSFITVRQSGSGTNASPLLSGILFRATSSNHAKGLIASENKQSDVWNSDMVFYTINATAGAVTDLAERMRLLGDATGSSPVLQFNGASTIRTSTGNLTLATNGGNGNINLLANGSGYVSINKTPSTTYRNLFLGGDNSGWNAGLTIQNDPTGDIWGIFGTTTDGFSIQRRDSAGLNPLDTIRILNNGNIGIGTTSPDVKLEITGAHVSGQGLLRVTGNTYAVATFNAATGYNSSFHFNTNSTPKWFVTNNNLDSSDRFEIGSRVGGDNIRLSILQTGNVGIGTTSPSARLQVATASTTGTTSMLVLSRASGYGHTLFEQTYDSTYFSNGKTLTLKNDSGTAFVHFAGNNAGTQTNVLIPTGNVGIGTTAPFGILTTSVSGTFTFDSNDADFSRVGLALTQSANVTNQVGSGIVWTLSSGRKVSAITNYFYADADQSGLNFYVQPTSSGSSATLTEAMRITSGGNVGIGTTSPTNLLHINTGLSSVSYVARFESGFINRGVKIGALSIGAIQGYSVSTDADANLSLNPTGGNVGIGTTSPSQKLHVVGNGLFTGTLEVDTVNNGVGDFLTRTSGGIITRRTAAEVLTDIGAQAALTNPVTGTGTSGQVSFWNGTTTQTGNNNLFWDNTNGRLGIGTTTPSAKLHVVTGTNKNILIKDATHTTLSNLTSALTFSREDGVSDLAAIFGWNNGGVALAGREGIVFATGGSSLYGSTVESMRITSTGNVGIGTTSPSQKLHVVGQTIIDGGIGVASSGTLHVRQKGDTVDDGIALTSSNTTAHRIWKNVNGLFSIGTNPNPSQLTINLDGNVGIGTTSPSSLLHVGGLSGAVVTPTAIQMDNTYRSGTPSFDKLKFYLFKNSTESYGIGLGNVADVQYWAGSSSTGTHTFFTSQTERMRITSAGNVGIGTTSPSALLHVTDGSGGNIAIGTNTVAVKQLMFGVNNDYSIQSNGGSYLRFHTAGAERMRITAAGDVGIGTTSPSEKLEVQGNIRITKTLLSNQENLDVDSGATRVIATIASATYDGAFFDFVIKKGTNLRAGTVYSVHNGTTVEFTETSTNDLGNTSDVTLSVDLSGGNIRLLATTLSNDWIIKSLVRGL